MDASNSGFKKTWLLHCVEEPAIANGITNVRRTEKGYGGRLVNTTLLPLRGNLEIRKVGGKGSEFTVQGKDFPQAIAAANNSGDSAVWRIEVLPRKASFSDRFLNAMQVMDDAASVQPLVAERLETGPFTGAKIGDRIVLFSKSGAAVKQSFSLTITGAGNAKVLITDVEKGTWRIENSGDRKQKRITASNIKGLIYFTTKSGSYKLTRQ